MKVTTKRSLIFGIRMAGIILVTVVFAFPLYWLFATSLKTRVQVFALPPKLVFSPTFANYLQVINSWFMGNLFNSFLIAALSTIFSIAIGSLAAYGFSRYPIKGSDNILFWILSLRMLPPIAIVLPLYVLFRALHLLDTHLALILIYSIFNISFTVWLMKGFFDEVPKDVEESAMLDGYRPLQVFYKVVLPLVRPGLVATAIFCLIQTLIEFLVALILTNRVAVTATVGMAKFQVLGVEWGQITAAAAIFILPIIIFTIFVRNQLIRGMALGGVR
ncbi:carbohydrate ABC transporter permease [Candidatus Aerophobetes bacterium]|nr:carbohydrate ABC transporter permease [Candidatus Aerophobetes bacterium]